LAIALRFAARSDVGLVRKNNQDSGYAGPHLLVIADGMGGHAGGDVASSLAIGELSALDGESHGSDALDHLNASVLAAHRELLARVDEEPQLSGMGTTVTALLRTGNRFALAHIGDSRAYLLRDGALVQITKDHTFVQTLVDEGRLTTEEAEQHPQRSVLMRVLSDIVDDVEPDLSMREARVGDRYLICSDGLSAVVSFETLQDTLAAPVEPTATCEALVALALRAGAPDNVTCIVADVVEAEALADTSPTIVGSAALRPRGRTPSTGIATPAERAAALTATLTPAVEDVEPAAQVRGPRLLRRALGGALVLAIVVAGGWTAWQWVQRQYFVGAHGSDVAIFRGLPQDVGPLHLGSVSEVARDVLVADLPTFAQDKVRKGIVADDLPKARDIVQQLRDQAAACRSATATITTPARTTSAGSTTAAGTTAGSTTPAANTTATRPTPTATSPTTGPTTSPGSGTSTTASTGTPAATSTSPNLDCGAG